MKLRQVTNEVAERTSGGLAYNTSIRQHKKLTKATIQPRIPHTDPPSSKFFDQDAAVAFLKRVFLPKGYPDSVTPDYLRYQIFNALQAFCSSLAGLLASRALLEGYGIGDPSASATNALLLNILLDVCSRTTTIISAHYLGSSLVPDAKRYRLLADILNDFAFVLDTLSPLFNSFGFPRLRTATLCLSASSRALCGIVAGGSKAAISLHFSSPTKGQGDIGDLNAKDASKETVLALVGMLLGSLIVPRLTTPFSTYLTLLVLIALHIVINYMGVQGLVLRTMNHQRLWTAWFIYDNDPTKEDFTPDIVNPAERLFPFTQYTYRLPFFHPLSFINPFSMETFSTFRNPFTQELLGYVTLGSSLSKALDRPLHPEIIAQFQHADFVLWFDRSCLFYPSSSSSEEEEPSSPIVQGTPHIHVCYKERCTPANRVQAWIAAGLLCKSIHEVHTSDPDAVIDAYETFLDTGLTHSPGSRRKGTTGPNAKPVISPVVSSLLTPRNQWDKSSSKPGWNDFQKKADRLGWVYDGGCSSDAAGEPVEVNPAVVMPEPHSVIVGLGYSYETKKDA